MARNIRDMYKPRETVNMPVGNKAKAAVERKQENALDNVAAKHTKSEEGKGRRIMPRTRPAAKTVMR
jgi:hypothetical protein